MLKGYSWRCTQKLLLELLGGVMLFYYLFSSTNVDLKKAKIQEKDINLDPHRFSESIRIHKRKNALVWVCPQLQGEVL